MIRFVLAPRNYTTRLMRINTSALCYKLRTTTCRYSVNTQNQYWYSCKSSGSKFCTPARVVIVNEIPDGANVVGELFRERERFANEPATALTQSVVEPLDVVGQPCVFAHRTMALGRQDSSIGIPKITVAHGTLAVDGWKRGPEFASTRFAT